MKKFLSCILRKYQKDFGIGGLLSDFLPHLIHIAPTVGYEKTDEILTTIFCRIKEIQEDFFTWEVDKIRMIVKLKSIPPEYLSFLIRFPSALNKINFEFTSTDEDGNNIFHLICSFKDSEQLSILKRVDITNMRCQFVLMTRTITGKSL